MEISITIEGWGLAWPRWKQLITKIEEYGFYAIYKSDHFTLGVDPHIDHLEAFIALNYLASTIPRMNFGTMVAPLSFRDPVMMARQAMAIDDLSGGRMILGLGAGWLQEEHVMFGYELGTLKQRFDRLEEGLQVITQLIRNDETITFEGKYFQLQEATLMPRPQRKTPVMIGGKGPKRTLPLIARYADIWNCEMASTELYLERAALLDDLLHTEGREPGDVKRTVTMPVLCWETESERDQMLEDNHEILHHYFGGTDKLLSYYQGAGISGSADYVIEQIKAYETAGVEEFVIRYMGMKGDTGLEKLAKHVLPQFM